MVFYYIMAILNKAKRQTDSDPAAGLMDQVKEKQADLEEEKKLGHEG